MSKRIMLGSLAILGAACFWVGTSDAEAASFEKMKEDVTNDTGVVFNPELSREMTKEETLKYISIIEAEQVQLKTSLVTPEIQEKALKQVASGKNIQSSKAELEMTRGASIPTSNYTLTGGTYTSNEFSGSGWRYSGYNFVFNNYSANPYFGVNVSGDSFEFRTRRNGAQVASYAVYPDGRYHYYPSTNAGNLSGYFATINPISGSRYRIN